jgi:hypothetical protein
MAGGTRRDRRPIDKGSPFSSSFTPITLQSQPIRLDVSADYVPSGVNMRAILDIRRFLAYVHDDLVAICGAVGDHRTGIHPVLGDFG